MKKSNALVLILVALFVTSCFKDDDDIPVTASELNDFVYRGMNLFYLYKDDVPDLADSRFEGKNSEYVSYLNSFASPRDLFQSLRFQPQSVDRFSRIFSNFIALEQLLGGVSLSNGMEFQIFTFSETDTNRYGIVTHVLPNSNAENQGVQRGDIFYAINGTQLTNENRFQLTGQDNYTINLGTYNDNGTPDDNTDDSVDATSQTIPLSKSQYSEDPIFINNVVEVDNKKIGYLMYNGFTNDFNSQLNTVFGNLNNANIDELVLDLRYNSGGSVASAILLSTLITGQFTGEIFSTEEWNSDIQAAFQERDPELLINRFPSRFDGSAINSLELSKVYILTTRSSASASELVINSLRPYIQVVQIGTTTTGKYQASRIVYDSPNFSREGVNSGHTVAMLPLIFKSLNVDGVTDYFEGLAPNIPLQEDLNNLGVLGNENEPLFQAAINDITGNSGRLTNQKTSHIKIKGHSKDYIPSGLGMYSDKDIPVDLLNR